jgi:eukaryotic-like serine/threonine-protein kinase
MGSPTIASVSEVGSTANRYQILAKLAAGGMAEIFLARGASVGGVERYCVLKRILHEHAKDALFVQMFVDEARLAAQLHHPNIASLYDIGMLGDSYFFTMEYVHGETIRSMLERAQELRRPVPLACVLTIIAGAAQGLHHAHERNAHDGRPLGIVHRDVSPANLMVSYEGNVKLVDFGVAKAEDRAVETRSGTVKGKISYLSPEQCRAERVDRRSDLFSLGIVMWEMLTGARLYRRDSDFENMTAIVKEPPPPPSSRRSEVPRAVDEIVLRLLAKSVTDRFQTAVEVVEAIENASMQARTILSTSAVSRLVEGLFGKRAEPWLELEKVTVPFEPVAVASRPIPKDVRAPVDAMALDLDGVFDLSSWSMIEEPDAPSISVETHDAEPPAPSPARAAVPTAAPSPASGPIAAPARPSGRHPRAPSPTAAPPLSAAAAPSGPIALPGAPSGRPSQPGIPLPPPPPPAVDTPASSGSWNTTLLDASPPIPWHPTLGEGGPLPATNSTLLGVSAPPVPSASVRPSGSPIPTWGAPQFTPAAHIATPPAGSPIINPASRPGEPMMTSGSSPHLPAYVTPSHAPAPGRRSTQPPPRLLWPLVAVIVLAAAVGVAAVWFAMRTSAAKTEDRAPDPASVLPAQPPAGEVPVPDPNNVPPGAPQGTAAVADSVDAGAAQGEANEAAGQDAPSPEAALDAGAAPPRAAPPGGASDRYAASFRACSKTTVTAELAGACTVAACSVHDAAKAQVWLSTAPPAARANLIAQCKEIGNITLKP